MKNLYTLILLVFTSPLFSQTYYWVGGTGAWSDLNHWATSSGGNTFHTQLPTQSNDVVFDQNSFSEPGQIVSLDMDEAFSKDFNTLAVTNNPIFQGDYYLDQLSIYGNLSLSNNATYDLKTVNMLQPSGNCLLTSGSTFLGGLCFIKLDGGANYYLQDSISVGNLYVYNAKFYSNDFPVHCSSRFRSNFSAGREVHLGESVLYTSEFVVTTDMVMDAALSTIKIFSQSPAFGDFEGAGFNYGNLIAEGYATIIGNNNFQIFSVLPGTEVTFTAGSVQTAQNFEFSGNALESIILNSTEPGTQATVSQSSGTVNGNFLVLQDMNATGGATFNANNTADLGNNTGWNIIEDLPANYYWVNGDGSWSDLNHWATTSGGNTYHLNLPNALDTVIIDQNSFLSGGVLSINTEAYCAEFRMTEAVEGIQINGNQPLHCFGSLSLSAGTIGNFYLIYPEGVNTGNTITTNGAHWGEGSTFVFSTDGEWLMADDFYGGTIEINQGTLRSEGNSINLHNQLNSYSDTPIVLDLSGSTVNLMYWRIYNAQGTYIFDGSTIHCSEGDFNGLNQSYSHLLFDGVDVEINGSFSCNLFEVIAGTELIIEAGNTISSENFDLTGTESEPISIQSSVSGEEVFFQKSGGTVDASYLILEDNHAIGGAQFNAVNSEFISNVEGWQLIIGVDEIDLDKSIYPNPAHSFTSIPALSGEVYQVFDLNGKCILQATMAMQNQPQISLDGFAPGYYIVKIQGNTQKAYQLIVN